MSGAFFCLYLLTVFAAAAALPLHCQRSDFPERQKPLHQPEKDPAPVGAPSSPSPSLRESAKGGGDASSCCLNVDFSWRRSPQILLEVIYRTLYLRQYFSLKV